MVGEYTIPENSTGLAFVMHGLSGYKEEAHIALLVDVLVGAGYSVVNFDATNSRGESGGSYENATAQAHYDDLEDVIAWAKNQVWYKEPFVLAGHSLGGYAVAQYAENHPAQVRAVFPYAAVVSGKLSLEAYEMFRKAILDAWKATGWKVEPNSKNESEPLRLRWSHMEERLNHDLLKEASKITMPVLFVVGENDTSCPPEHQRALYDLVPGKKEFHVIEGARHVFKDKIHLDSLRSIFSNWLSGLE